MRQTISPRRPLLLSCASLLFLLGASCDGGSLHCDDWVASIIEPHEIVFDAALGETSTEYLTISNVGSVDIVVDDVRLETRTADLRMETTFSGRTILGPEEELVIAFTYEPTELMCDLGDVFISCSDPDHPSFRVPVRAGVRLVHTPNQINFGMVEIGNRATVLLALTNIGGCSATINDFFLAGSNDFFLEKSGEPVEPNLPMHLEAQDSFHIDVVYEPTGEGCDEGSIYVDANSPDGTAMSLWVEGRAGVQSCDD